MTSNETKDTLAVPSVVSTNPRGRNVKEKDPCDPCDPSHDGKHHRKRKKRYNWNLLIILVTPLALIPLLLIDDDLESNAKWKTMYVIFVMSVYWISESLPLAVTSIIPVVLLPFLGVMDATRVCQNYMKETNMIYLGGLIVASAMQYCRLHLRVALRVMKIFGSSPIRLMLGIMLVTMFWSMWLSATVCTAAMVPIAMTIVDELCKSPDIEIERERTLNMNETSAEYDYEYATSDNPDAISVSSFRPRGATNSSQINPTERRRKRRLREDTWKKNLKKMYLFAVAYSATIGGTAVITGTGPNKVFKEVIKPIKVGQDGKYMEISFATWSAFNIPIMLMNILIAFILLYIKYHGIPRWRELIPFQKKDEIELENERTNLRNVQEFLHSESEKLGSVKFHEWGVTFIFFLVVVSWVLRDIGDSQGWKQYIEGAEAGDSTAVMFGVLLLFIIPRKLRLFLRTEKACPRDHHKYETLLDWEYCQEKLNWGVVFLFGAGFALADASYYSGLSGWLGEQLQVLENLPNVVLLLVIMFSTTIAAEVVSNIACANLIVPVLITLSRSLKLHPLFLTMPTAVTCSYAFVMPAANPVNSIIYSTGNLRITEMIWTGSILNFLCIAIFYAMHISYGNLIFDFENYEWYNATATSS